MESFDSDLYIKQSSCRLFGIDPFLVLYTAEDEPSTGDDVCLEKFPCATVQA